jgi:hypothetical protein
MAASPIQELFTKTLPPCLRRADVYDPEISDYVLNMLLRFVHSDAQQTEIGGFVVEDLARMVEESDPVFGSASSFIEERRIRQHIGDSALFFSGLMPGTDRYRLRLKHRAHTMEDLVRVGKASYRVVSGFDVFEYRSQARLFFKLADRFEDCMRGLRLMGCNLNLAI